VENFSDRQQRNAHEKSHQSATIRDEIDEPITLRSLIHHKLIFFEVNLEFGDASNIKGLIIHFDLGWFKIVLRNFEIINDFIAEWQAITIRGCWSTIHFYSEFIEKALLGICQAFILVTIITNFGAFGSWKILDLLELLSVPEILTVGFEVKF
jgi:hypothetical protein